MSANTLSGRSQRTCSRGTMIAIANEAALKAITRPVIGRCHWQLKVIAPHVPSILIATTEWTSDQASKTVANAE